ncbi:MAG: M20 family metallopeptidase [Micrococcales bacterium]
MDYKAFVAEATSWVGISQGIRRELHQIPEFGLNLPKTQARVRASIEGLGEIHEGRGLNSLALLIKGAHPGPTVLIRADMDALAVIEDTSEPFASTNGYMHACGHDLHMSIGIGVAHMIATHKDKLHGDVVIWFQPGEEGHGGADIMLEEGAHLISGSKPIAAYGIHVFSAMLPRGVFASRPGAMMASAGDLLVKVHGAGGHGSTPWMAKDPITPLLEMAHGLQAYLNKTLNAFDPVVINLGWLNAGDTHTTNVIPETASFGATVRTFSKEHYDKVRAIVPTYLEGIAAAHGLKVDVEFSAATKVLINDKDAVERVEKIVQDTFGVERYLDMPTPMAGGEDMASIIDELGGAFVFLGAAKPGVDFMTAAVNHSNKAEFDDSVIPDGVALLTALAFSHLSGE